MVRFDCYEVDLAGGQIYKQGVRLRLPDQSFRVLASLLEHPGQAVTRDDLRQCLWPNEVFVDFDNVLNCAVARLRETLGDPARNPRFIETLPKRGYRFIAPVSGADGDGDASIPAGAPANLTAEASAASDYNPLAYHEYLQGRRYLQTLSDRQGYEAARAHFERALTQEPSFALAHEALAELYFVQAYMGMLRPRDAIAAGILHGVRALEFDSTRAEARALLAQYSKQLDYNWPEIERELKRVRELAPTSSLVRLTYAIGWLVPQGLLDEAIAEIERAVELEPASTWSHAWLGILMGLTRQWDRAIEQSRVLTGLDPDSAAGPWVLSFGLRGKGRFDEAIAANLRAVELSGDSAMMLGWLGLLLGGSGKGDEARAVLERLESKAQHEYVPPASYAWIYLGLRDIDRAFDWMDRAVEERDQLMMPIKSYAFFDPIRTHPRYLALLHNMKLDR